MYENASPRLIDSSVCTRDVKLKHVCVKSFQFDQHCSYIFTSGYPLFWRERKREAWYVILLLRASGKYFGGSLECLRNCSKNRVPLFASPSTHGHPTLAVTQVLKPASLSLNNTYWFLPPIWYTHVAILLSQRWVWVSYRVICLYNQGEKFISNQETPYTKNTCR